MHASASQWRWSKEWCKAKANFKWIGRLLGARDYFVWLLGRYQSKLYFRMRCWQHNSRHTLQGHGSTAVKSLRSFKSQLEIGIPPPCWKINYTYHCYLYVISVTSYFIIVSTFKHLSCTAKVGIELVQDSIILQRLRQWSPGSLLFVVASECGISASKKSPEVVQLQCETCVTSHQTFL